MAYSPPPLTLPVPPVDPVLPGPAVAPPRAHRARPLPRSTPLGRVLRPVALALLVLATVLAPVSSGSFGVQPARPEATITPAHVRTGVQFVVSPPRPYRSWRAERTRTVAYEVVVTVTNNTDRPLAAPLITVTATGVVVQQVRLRDAVVRDIAPGARQAVPCRFHVPVGAFGPVRITVSPLVGRPVSFTGSL